MADAVEAQIEALRVRRVRTGRTRETIHGPRIVEADAAALEHRDRLAPAWTRTTVSELRVEAGRIVPSGDTERISIGFLVPPGSLSSGSSRIDSLQVWAEVKGQIDPSGSVRVERQP
jgi:hypothetical protein